MATRTFDAVVIGGGPGGYVCSIRLGQLKQKVLCVEKEEVGGVCLNWGCVPSKALIAASHTYEKAKNGASMGLLADNVRVDVDKMQDWKGGIVKQDHIRALMWYTLASETANRVDDSDILSRYARMRDGMEDDERLEAEARARVWSDQYPASVQN